MPTPIAHEHAHLFTPRTKPASRAVEPDTSPEPLGYTTTTGLTDDDLWDSTTD